MALAALGTGKDIPVLSSAQLDLAEKVISILGPIDEIANSIWESIFSPNSMW